MTIVTKSHRIIRVALCVGPSPHAFNIVLEHDSDLSMSHISDTGARAEGFLVYRDRAFVRCPYCDSYCRLAPGMIDIEVIKRD